MTGRAVLLAFALLALCIVLLISASHGGASCGFGCLHRQIEAIRRQTLPVRVLALEERLEADERRLEVQSAHVSWLEGRLGTLETSFTSLKRCIGEIPLTRYGSTLGPSGYLFQRQDDETREVFPTTALDLTGKGDEPGVWGLVDSCEPVGGGSGALSGAVVAMP